MRARFLGQSAGVKRKIVCLMACAEMGKFAEAQMAAQQALDFANAAKMRELEPIRQRLALYKNHRPWRENFRATNAPVKTHGLREP